MQIVNSRSQRAVTGTVSKQVFDSLVLLVESKLEYFVAITYSHAIITVRKWK